MDSEIVLRLLNATLAYMMARDDLRQLRAQKAERCDIQAAALEVEQARQRLAGLTRQAHHELR